MKSRRLIGPPRTYIVAVYADRAEGVYVRFGSKADMCSAKGHVRSTPKSGHGSGIRDNKKTRAFAERFRGHVPN